MQGLDPLCCNNSLKGKTFDLFLNKHYFLDLLGPKLVQSLEGTISMLSDTYNNIMSLSEVEKSGLL